MNSDKHREIRRLNASDPNAWSPHCDCCENREKITNFEKLHPNSSRRLFLMKIDNGTVTADNYLDK